MAQIVSLAASPRQATGKGGARQARFRGRVPAVIYGHGRDTQSLEVEAKALEKALQGVEPESTIIELAVEAAAEVAEPGPVRKVREGEEEEGEAAEGGAPAKPEAKSEKPEKAEKTEKPKGGKES